MKNAIFTALAATALVGTVVTGCGNKSSTSSTSSGATTSSSATTSSKASTSAQPMDYGTLLIKETDIPGNEPFTASPPMVSPGGQPGVAGEFHNQAGTRVIGDTILVFADASQAATALKGSQSALGSSVTGTPESAAVGTGGTIVAGTSPDGSKAATVLLFSEGKAVVTIEFDSAPDDAVPPDAAIELGQKQAAIIKKALS